MQCFASNERPRKRCGSATHVWREPGDGSATLLTLVCDGHARTARERGWEVKPLASLLDRAKRRAGRRRA